MTAADPVLAQDAEWTHIEVEGARRRVRLHDYGELYKVPGLYEGLYRDGLACDSPRTVCRLLAEHLAPTGVLSTELRVLDLGAGNGMAAEELNNIGVRRIVGVDVLEAAAEAAQRDRPGVYEDYVVADLADLDPVTRDRLDGHRFNCLLSVAALGFDDVSTEAFAAAFGLVCDGGWVAFNIKEDFLDYADRSGFARLVNDLLDDGIFEERGRRRYRHRLTVDGDELYYVAIAGRKRAGATALRGAVSGS